MVQQTNMSCECDSLKAQLAAAERRSSELSQRCQQLEIKMLETLDSIRPAVAEGSTPGSSLAAQTTVETSPRCGQLSSNPDHQFTSRIMRPTFPSKPTSRELNRSFMSSAWELWGDDTIAEEPETNVLALNHDDYINLVDVFFDRRWPYLPVLHRQTFINEHLTPFLAKSETRPISKFLVHIVCAIALAEKLSHYTSDKGHRILFKDAVNDLHIVMGSENFECVQCLLLLCMYGHNDPQSVNMWYTTGMALNLAIGIDLHRKESLTEKDLMTQEMYKRVFWCTYVMNCSIAINMGRPLGIQESDISMPLPLQLTDGQLNEFIQSPHVEETLIPHVADMSTFIHIIKLRRINAGVYKTFHSIGPVLLDDTDLDQLRNGYFMELNQWLIAAPRYMQTLSTFQSTEWFQIAFHHAVLSLYRPSRAAPTPSPHDLQICTESAIGLISSYSALYARNRIKYTFVAIHSLFMAAVTMLYSLRAFAPLRRDLTKPVVQTNLLTFLTLFRGICNGSDVGEKCCGIVQRLGDSILTLFENEIQADSNIDTEFQKWFGLQTHTFPSQASHTDLQASHNGSSPYFPDIQVDLPWADLFTEGIDMGTADSWSVLL